MGDNLLLWLLPVRVNSLNDRDVSVSARPSLRQEEVAGCYFRTPKALSYATAANANRHMYRLPDSTTPQTPSTDTSSELPQPARLTTPQQQVLLPNRVRYTSLT